jgi:aerobic-type carbon monoxide dehydrogenase small subunit (CoxS/CutS family)
MRGQAHRVDAPDDKPLLWVLRDELHMTGTKFGCGAALWGGLHSSHVNARKVFDNLQIGMKAQANGA